MEFRRVLFRSLYAGKIKGRNIGTEGRQRNIGEICDDAGRGLAKRNLPDTAQGNGGIFFASFGSSPETRGDRVDVGNGRSEEHTSELQSLMRISYAVFCLKKKKNKVDLRKRIYKRN